MGSVVLISSPVGFGFHHTLIVILDDLGGYLSFAFSTFPFMDLAFLILLARRFGLALTLSSARLWLMASES